MTKNRIFSAIFLAAMLMPSSALPRSNSTLHGPSYAAVSVCFTPAQTCNTLIAQRISQATEIRVQAYGFTSPVILKALADKQKSPGGQVKVILDESNLPNTQERSRYTGATFAANAGIETWIDNKPRIAHNKIIILDGTTVITGSYNFTVSAEQNAENVVIIESSEVAAAYLENWESRRIVSQRYIPSNDSR